MARKKDKKPEPMPRPKLEPVIKTGELAKIKVFVSGRVKVSSNDNRVAIVRRD